MHYAIEDSSADIVNEQCDKTRVACLLLGTDVHCGPHERSPLASGETQEVCAQRVHILCRKASA